MRRLFFGAGTTLVALLVVAAWAVAAEHGAAEGGEAHHGPNYVDFGLRVANLILFIGLIWWLAGKKIKAFFGGRRDQIKHELEDLDARRKSAEAKLRDVERSIANIEQERQDILDEAARQGESLKEAIVAEAEAKAARIREQAELAVVTERNVALTKLRSEMADMIVEAAEKMLKDKLTKQEHEALVDEYLTKVVLN